MEWLKSIVIYILQLSNQTSLNSLRSWVERGRGVFSFLPGQWGRWGRRFMCFLLQHGEMRWDEMREGVKLLFLILHQRCRKSLTYRVTFPFSMKVIRIHILKVWLGRQLNPPQVESTQSSHPTSSKNIENMIKKIFKKMENNV